MVSEQVIYKFYNDDVIDTNGKDITLRGFLGW